MFHATRDWCHLLPPGIEWRSGHQSKRDRTQTCKMWHSFGTWCLMGRGWECFWVRRLLEFKHLNWVLKGRLGGCCPWELRGSEELTFGTGKKKGIFHAAEFSDTVVCGFTAKRRCLGLDGIFYYILGRKSLNERGTRTFSFWNLILQRANDVQH